MINNKEEVTVDHTWTYADTAQVMADLMPDFDWDSWKDEMKEQDI